MSEKPRSEQYFLDLLQQLRAQVEEETILEGAAEIFNEAIEIVKERRRKRQELAADQASKGAERMHDLMVKAKAIVQDADVAAENLTQFTSRVVAAHPKRAYHYRVGLWKCPIHGELKLTKPEANVHSHEKGHELELLAEDVSKA